MTHKFRGVFAALVTPFDRDEVSSEKFLENILKYNNFDLSGYVILGSNAECVYLSDGESEQLVKTAKEAAAPGKKVIVGTARESTKLTIDFTNRMAELEIDAALVRPPSFFKARMTSEALKKHYLNLADHSNVPILIYNIPQNTGISLDSRLIVELSQHPNIAGIKESSGSLAILGEVIPKIRPGFCYLMGAASVFLPGLILGACGAILALANLAPGLCTRLYKLCLEGRKEESLKLQLDLVPLNKAIMETYGIPSIKYGLDLLGFYGGQPRLPLLPVEEKGKAEIAHLLRKLGLLGS
jgi:4-hydroxy-2-oxoglutarate aldolase